MKLNAVSDNFIHFNIKCGLLDWLFWHTIGILFIEDLICRSMMVLDMILGLLLTPTTSETRNLQVILILNFNI